MRIVHIIPGSGGTFYCENCVRDSYSVNALRKRGHDVLMVPMYLPLYGHEGVNEDVPLFFGGVNTWLQQHSGVFRSTPGWIDRLFDSSWLLRMAARRAGSTRASSLGDMTVSMLRGAEGRQSKEVQRLSGFLSGELKPDVIHLSNALLLGLAGPLKKSTGAAIVCTLQDEAPWIDSMGSPWKMRVWEALGMACGEVDAFISVSNAYADEMEKRLGLPGDRLHVVHIGVDASTYRAAPLDLDPPVIGYMARMSEGCGLGQLAEAFVQLKKIPGNDDVRLHVTGGKTGDDDRFLARVRKRFHDAGVSGDVSFFDDFGSEARRSFLEQLSVMSVPGSDQSAFGLYILEAMAAGVPVVEPEVGGFPELVRTTGGGIIYDPGDPEGLQEALARLLADGERLRELGRRAREGVTRHFSLDGMVQQVVEVYEDALSGKVGGGTR